MRLVSAIYNEWYPFHSWEIFNDFINTSDPNDLKPGDVVVVWGGADISPTLYNKNVSRMCHAGSQLSYRDKIEFALMQRAKELNIPIIGVCRGAQMLCALAGGYLIQHIDGHIGKHPVQTPSGKSLVVNSIHHQMMVPENTDHELLAWSPQKLSKVYWDENNTVDVPLEPEYIYFKDVKGFAIQWHPEMMEESAEATQYIRETFHERI